MPFRDPAMVHQGRQYLTLWNFHLTLLHGLFFPTVLDFPLYTHSPFNPPTGGLAYGHSNRFVVPGSVDRFEACIIIHCFPAGRSWTLIGTIGMSG